MFKPLSAAEFVRAENELDELLGVVSSSTGARVTRRTGTYGYEWLVFDDPDFEDLVNAVHLVGAELQSRGFGPQLLAAVFRFDGQAHPVYWIYGYKRGAFWPFVPTGKEQERDNAEELELKAKLETSSRSSRTSRDGSPCSARPFRPRPGSDRPWPQRTRLSAGSAAYGPIGRR